MFGDIRVQYPRLYLVISSLQEFGIAIVLQSAIIVRFFLLDRDFNVLVFAVIIMISAMITCRVLIFNDLYRIAQNDSIVNSTTDPDVREKIWLKGAIDTYDLFFKKHNVLNSKFLFLYHQVIFAILLLQILLQS